MDSLQTALASTSTGTLAMEGAGLGFVIPSSLSEWGRR